MNTIKITYDARNAESTRKAYEAIRILKQNGIDGIAHLPIVQENMGAWKEIGRASCRERV